MTPMLPFGRTVSGKLAPQTSRILTRLTTTTPLPRLPCIYSCTLRLSPPQSNCLRSAVCVQNSRTYATDAAPKPPGRPKGHTGRAAAKSTATKKTTTKTTGPKTTAGKENVGRKKKAAAKPKPKPKPKAKPKIKKPPSPRMLQRTASLKKKELKEKALLDVPKKLPDSVWAVIFGESNQKGSTLAENSAATKVAGEKLKNLDPEEHENYNKIANANKAKNEAAYKKWLSGFTPDQIREANLARQALGRDEKEKYPDRKNKSHKFAKIKDERIVKRPVPAYALFLVDRHKSGDFNNMTAEESAKLIGREWKALSDADKKPYNDSYGADYNRYVEEYKTVYGRDVPATRAKVATAA